MVALLKINCRVMNVIKYSIFLLGIISCTSNAPKAREKEMAKNAGSGTHSNIMKFVFENDTLRQLAELRFEGNNSLSFELTTINKLGGLENHFEGTAKIKDGDIEIDEDAEGNAYPVLEYVFEKDCWLSFRIDKDTQTRLKVIESNCILNDNRCPLGSLGLMYKE